MSSTRSITSVVKSDQLKHQLSRISQSLEFRIQHYPSIHTLLHKLDIAMYDIIVISSASSKEYGLSQIEDLLQQIGKKAPHSQILFLTEPEDIEFVGMTFSLDFVHFVKLPVTDEELGVLFENANFWIEEMTLKTDTLGEDRMGQIVGASEAMQSVYKQIRRAAQKNVSIMLVGETGTGKDLAAQAIHQASKRSNESYIPVNLGALPSELVASELFGHEKGSFTGASKQHIGKFEQAHNGTLFLDEIDAMDEKVQISLLRILEDKKFTRLGGVKPIRSDARLIGATNQDLQSLVSRNRFRKDLFYRLDVFRIEIPPLRKRYGDIPLLISNFISMFGSEFDSPVKGVSANVLQSLETYDWPGNVRELKNVIQRAILMCEGDTIELDHLPDRLSIFAQEKPTIAFDIGTSLDEVERTMILRALDLAENNRKRAAELLGISRRAIYNKLKKHQIE